MSFMDWMKRNNLDVGWISIFLLCGLMILLAILPFAAYLQHIGAI